MHLCSFIPACVQGCRCWLQVFILLLSLPFSVQAGLQIFAYLCFFFFFWFIDLLSEPLYLKLLVFLLTLVLVFVTCVLALCRDGSKQISDLPCFVLFLFLLNKLWHTELMTQNSSNAWVICKLWILCWQGSVVIEELCLIKPPSTEYVTVPTEMGGEKMRLLTWSIDDVETEHTVKTSSQTAGSSHLSRIMSFHQIHLELPPSHPHSQQR